MADRDTIQSAGKTLAAWAIFQAMMRDKVRRTYAVIDGRVLDSTHVVYHCPEAMR